MAEPVTLTVGEVELVRASYFDVGLAPEDVSLTADVVRAAPWGRPAWTDGDGQVLVGQALWVLRSGGTTVVVDPCGASDAFLRTGPDAVAHQEAMVAALRAAGVEPDEVDVVLLSHLDGIGLAAVVDEAGAWSPAFPGARVLVTATELARILDEPAGDAVDVRAFRALVAHGVVDAVADGHEVAPGVLVDRSGGHLPGHAVIRVGRDDERAVLVGHLAVSPLHLAAGECAGLHADPAAAWRLLGELVAESATEGTLLIGPLWPTPGVARAERRDGSFVLVPAV